MIAQKLNYIRLYTKEGLVQLFSKKKPQNSNKIQTVGFATKNIQDFKSLTYFSKEPIIYTNKKLLLYRSAQNSFDILKLYLPTSLPFGIFCYLHYFNIGYQSFPVIKFFYYFAEILFGILITKRFSWNHNIVKEIYLLEGGNATEIVFQNRIKRKMFQESLTETYYNSLFTTPIVQMQDQSILKILFRNFPTQLKQFEKKVIFGKFWIKFYSNFDNYMLIPMKYQFLNKQLLVMSGKVIKS